MDPDWSSLRDAFTLQATFCASHNRSPINARLLQYVADHLCGSSADPRAGDVQHSLRVILRPFVEWKLDKLHADAVAIRLAAGFHNYALKVEDEEFSRMFPSDKNDWRADEEGAAASLPRLLSEERVVKELIEMMMHEPQTNEVNRCIMFLPAFLLVTERFPDKSMVCLEMGASAALNTMFHRFHYQFGNDGKLSWGDEESGVCLSTNWQGPFPSRLLSLNLNVDSVKASDRSPVNLAEEDERRRLMSYVWPGQKSRLQRLQAALKLASKVNLKSAEQADATDWVEQNVVLHPGQVTVLYHSFILQYLSVEDRHRITTHMHRLGEQASTDSPLAWISVEDDSLETVATDGTPTYVTKLTVWPADKSGKTEQVLYECDPHGVFIKCTTNL